MFRLRTFYTIVVGTINLLYLVVVYRKIHRIPEGFIAPTLMTFFCYFCMEVIMNQQDFSYTPLIVFYMFSYIISWICVNDEIWRVYSIRTLKDLENMFDESRDYKPKIGFDVHFKDTSEERNDDHREYFPLLYDTYSDFSEITQVKELVKPLHFYFPIRIILSPKMELKKQQLLDSITGENFNISVCFKETCEEPYLQYGVFIPEKGSDYLKKITRYGYGSLLLFIFVMLGLCPSFMCNYKLNFEEVSIPLIKTVYDQYECKQ